MIQFLVTVFLQIHETNKKLRCLGIIIFFRKHMISPLHNYHFFLLCHQTSTPAIAPISRMPGILDRPDSLASAIIPF